jgi:hypothetical protein
MLKHTKTSSIRISFCKPWYKWSVQVRHINVRLNMRVFGYLHLVDLCYISIQANRYAIHWIKFASKLKRQHYHSYFWNSFVCFLICHKGDISLYFFLWFSPPCGEYSWFTDMYFSCSDLIDFFWLHKETSHNND